MGPLLQTDPVTAPTSGALEGVLWPKAHFVIVLCVHPKSCTGRQDADLKQNKTRDLGVQFQGKQATWPRRLKILR